MPRPLLRAWRIALALPAVSAAAQDPCLAFEDVAERIACYAAADASAQSGRESTEERGWLVGEETDPITDETSIVLRRRARPAQPDDHLLPRTGGRAEPGGLRDPGGRRRVRAGRDPGEALFRYRVVPGAGTRTVRFGLDGLAELLPRVERSCGPR